MCVCTLCWDGVLAAAGCGGLAAVATGSLHRVSAGTMKVQLEASGQNPDQLLVGLALLLQGALKKSFVFSLTQNPKNIR